jgi:hypothetical protein
MPSFNRSRLVVALLCGVLCILTAAPSFAAGVVVRRGVLGRQRVVVRQPGPQAIVVGPRHAAAIIAPQAVVVPQAFVAPQSIFVPQQQLIVRPRASAIIIR